MKIFVRLVLALGLFAGCLVWLFLNIGDLLSAADELEPADAVLVLSGDATRVEKAVAVYRDGLAGSIVVTTDQVRREMLAMGIVPEAVVAASWSATTTYEEGGLSRELLDHRGYRRVLVVTDPYHLYRARWTFGHFFADTAIEFSFISSGAEHLHGFWWTNPAGRVFVLSELPRIVYYWLWHGLLGIAEDPAWTRELERRYMAFIGG